MGLLRLSSVPRVSLGDPTVPRPCVFWSLRLASVGIWETGLERQPVQGPCHCTEIVFPAPPLLFSVTASARSWRSRGWSPLPFLDLLCGFTAAASPPGHSAS